MSASEQLSDLQLLILLKQGDKKATDQLIKRYIPVAKSIAKEFYSYSLDEDDLIQEGMLGFIDGAYSYNEKHGVSFKSFMNLCIRRRIINAIQSCNRKKDFPVNSLTSIHNEELLDIPDENISPEDFLIAKESAKCLSSLIEDELSQLEINVLRLSIIGCSYSEISKRLNKSLKTVDNALQRARAKLNKLVS